jgi:hypothetical protein
VCHENARSKIAKIFKAEGVLPHIGIISWVSGGYRNFFAFFLLSKIFIYLEFNRLKHLHSLALSFYLEYLMKFKSAIILCVFLSLACGCVRSINSDRLLMVSVDMEKSQIVKKLGYPSVVRGSIKNKHGEVIEVWEYRVDQGKTSDQLAGEFALTALTLGLCAPVLLSEGEINAYWLYFCDGKLVKWGQAGDWSREADVIQEIRFNAFPCL